MRGKERQAESSQGKREVNTNIRLSQGREICSTRTVRNLGKFRASKMGCANRSQTVALYFGRNSGKNQIEHCDVCKSSSLIDDGTAADLSDIYACISQDVV